MRARLTANPRPDQPLSTTATHFTPTPVPTPTTSPLPLPTNQRSLRGSGVET